MVREKLGKVLGIDAGGLEPESDPPPPAGDIKADIDAFTSLDACVEKRDRLDPLLGDAIESIGYDTFMRDACRVIEAAKALDRRRCEAISASSLRAHCEVAVAQRKGNADECPWVIDGRPQDGRDPACVAVASGDARLCVSAEENLSRVSCRATVTGNVTTCEELVSRTDRARCSRDAVRWRTALPPHSDSSEPFATSGRLRLDPPSSSDGPAVDRDLALEVSRGVVLNEGFAGARFTVGALEDAVPSFMPSSPLATATFAFEIRLTAHDAVVDRAELVAPSKAALATPAAHSTLRVKLDKAGHGRGDALELSVDGGFGDRVAPWHVHVELRTFVRDVVRERTLER